MRILIYRSSPLQHERYVKFFIGGERKELNAETVNKHRDLKLKVHIT